MSTKSNLEKSAEEVAEATDQTIRKAADKGLEKVEKGVDKAAEVAHDVADRTFDNAERAIDQTRRAVDQGLSRAERSVRGLQAHTDPTIDDLAHKALDVATVSINLLADKGERARQCVLELQDATNRYVYEKPGKSLLFAAAAGALFTLLLTSGKRR